MRVPGGSLINAVRDLEANRLRGIGHVNHNLVVGHARHENDLQEHCRLDSFDAAIGSGGQFCGVRQAMVISCNVPPLRRNYARKTREIPWPS